MDVESLGHICKILYTYEHAMEIVALHVRITDLLFSSLQFLEEYDCETVGMSFPIATQYNSWKLIDDKVTLRQLLVTWETSFSLYNIPWQSTRFVPKLYCCEF